MPGRDGTGPMGAGAMSGRGLGPCTGVNRTAYGAGFGAGPGAGLGFGCRRGFGRLGGFFGGFGRGFAPEQVTQKNQKELLKEQKDFFQDRIEAIDKQLEDL
jgi:hypothetical protein